MGVSMPVRAVVGANWGDEGKGKVTDYFAKDADYVVRFQGGSNAGHTVINEFGEFQLHLLPSGVFYPHVTNVLGPSVALNVDIFFKELDELMKRGVPEPKLAISDRAQIVLPIHTLLDELEEERLGIRAFGSTKAGIAPFYSDKALHVGIQVNELFNPHNLEARIAQSLEAKNVLIEHLYGRAPIDIDEVMQAIETYPRRLKPFVCDVEELLHDGLTRGQRILLEAQLGALRDPDHGIHPYPTSSSPLAGFGSVGAGIPPYEISDIVAVTKAYSTCVGAGHCVTELHDRSAEELRNRGGDAGEYGATTGRPRRVGWFDAVATRYGCRVQGATNVALTNLDVLGYMDEIQVCTHYELDGNRTDRFPVPSRLEASLPVYETLPGWRSDITSVKAWDDLPKCAKQYVSRIEALIDCPIRFISVGPERNQFFER
jgi:adenylosuccinate synthase